MPASIVSSVLLWSSLVLPGTTAEPRGRPDLRGPGWAVATLDPSATIRDWSPDRSASWTLSEAASEGEESDDGDPDGIASGLGRPRSFPDAHALTGSIRPSRSVNRSQPRSPILRC